MNNIVNHLNVLTLNVGYAHHEADWNWQTVQSPFARLYLVTEGEAYVKMNNMNIHLTPGHLYLIPAYTTHDCLCTGHFCHYYVHIYEDVDAQQSTMEKYEFPVEVNADKYSETMMKRLCYLYPFLKLPGSNPDSYNNYQTLMSNIQKNSQCSISNNMEAQGLLFIFMAKFFCASHLKNNVDDDRIALTLQYIRQNISKNIDIKQLADMACMSKDYYIRLFKQQLGTTPNSFVTTKKMEKAQLLLITTNNPVNVIASSLGYDDCSYFIRTFKKTTGKTPLQYRAK